jgi:hypothetical protein
VNAGDALMEKARDYELSALAATERGASFEASLFTAIAITLYEVATALVVEREAA